MPREENITDDQGAYRISGVQGQKYVLEAQMSLTRREFSSNGKGNTAIGGGSHIYSFSTYSGNATRLKDAEPFSIKAGEERRAEDVEIPADKLHTVRGNILAQRDGHVINGALVSLIYQDDHNSQASWSWVTNANDSFFQLNFVPEGDYILRVSDAADNEYVESRDPNSSRTQIVPHALRSYGPAQIPLHIEGDMSGVTIAVPDVYGVAAPPRM